MTLARWEPVTEIERITDRFDRFFDELWRDFEREFAIAPRRRWLPAMDLSETDTDYWVRIELPGVKKEDVEITITQDILTIKGKRQREQKEEKEGYHRVERYYGEFQRSVRLPGGVDADKVEATYKDGVLEIRLPKREESKTKHIEVKAA